MHPWYIDSALPFQGSDVGLIPIGCSVPDTKQVSKGKSFMKKPKGEFVLWEKSKFHWVFGRPERWWKIGAYRTKEIAENVIRQRKLSSWKPIIDEDWMILPRGKKPDKLEYHKGNVKAPF